MSPISFPDNCSLNYLFINYQLYIRLTGRFFVHKIKPDRSDTTLNTLTGKENYKTGSEVGLFCVDCPFIKQLWQTLNVNFVHMYSSNRTTDGLLVCLVSCVRPNSIGFVWENKPASQRDVCVVVVAALSVSERCFLLTWTRTFTVLLSPVDDVIAHILLALMSWCHIKNNQTVNLNLWLHQIDAAFRLHHASRADGFTVVSVWTSSRSAACLAEALQNRYAGLLFLMDAGARRSNSAEFSTKQTGSQAQSDYMIIVGTPWSRDTSCRPYWAVVDSKHNRLADGGWRSKPGSEL